MCVRFTIPINLGVVAKRFGVKLNPSEQTAWFLHSNIAPAQTVIVVGDDGPATSQRCGGD